MKKKKIKLQILNAVFNLDNDEIKIDSANYSEGKKFNFFK